MSSVSVVVYADRPAPELSATLASLDEQTMPATEIQVILATGNPDLARRLDRYAQFRPNVVVHQNDGPAEASKHGAAALAVGTWTLVLGPGVMERRVRVLPEALQRLTRYAAENDLDRLTGRVSYRSAAGLLDGLFLEDAVWVGDAPDRPEPFVLYRTAVLTDPRRHTRRGGVLAGYPSLYLDPRPSNTPPITRSAVTTHWVDGRLRIEVTLRSEAPALTERRLQDQRLRFAVHHPESGLDFWLPTDAPAATDPDSEVRVARAELDPRRAALGEPLVPGVWEVWISVADPDGTGCRLRIPAVDATAAVLDGLLVSTARHGDGLAIDVGATRYPITGPLPADGADVVESRHGSLATLMVPALHVIGESRIRGRLLQRGYPSPATLVCSGGAARVECFLSGLASTNQLSVAFGDAGPADTGLSLRIEPSGGMTIIPTPQPPRPDPTPITDPEPIHETVLAPPRHRPKPPPTALTRLRHRIPSFLEPAARRLSHNPAARAFYRRVNRSLRSRG